MSGSICHGSKIHKKEQERAILDPFLLPYLVHIL